MSDIDVWIAAHTLVAQNESEAIRRVKPLCVGMAQLGATGALRAVGIEIDVPAEIEGIYPDVTHAESWDLAVRIADRYISDEDAHRFAENLTLAGTPDQISRRLEVMAGAGVEAVYMLGHSSYELPGDILRYLDRLEPRSSDRIR